MHQLSMQIKPQDPPELRPPSSTAPVALGVSVDNPEMINEGNPPEDAPFVPESSAHMEGTSVADTGADDGKDMETDDDSTDEDDLDALARAERRASNLLSQPAAGAAAASGGPLETAPSDPQTLERKRRRRRKRRRVRRRYYGPLPPWLPPSPERLLTAHGPPVPAPARAAAASTAVDGLL
jgi:hypothetical protein